MKPPGEGGANRRLPTALPLEFNSGITKRKGTERNTRSIGWIARLHKIIIRAGIRRNSPELVQCGR